MPNRYHLAQKYFKILMQKFCLVQHYTCAYEKLIRTKKMMTSLCPVPVLINLELRKGNGYDWYKTSKSGDEINLQFVHKKQTRKGTCNSLR